jgi:hypothetical protein
MPRVVPSLVVGMIDRLFPEISQGNEAGQYSTNYKARLHAVATLAKQVPADLLTMSPEAYSDFVVSIETIELHIDYWHSRGTTDFVPNVSCTHGPIALIRRGLSECPDDVLDPETAGLCFIADEEFRDSIRRDVSAANQAFHNDEWKAATVLGGSAIEALLLWQLQQLDDNAILTAIAAAIQPDKLTRRPHRDLERWNLHDFVEVCAEANLISADTRASCNLAKDFRNLIHPGAAARRGLLCYRGTALTALAALEHVIRDLTP